MNRIASRSSARSDAPLIGMSQSAIELAEALAKAFAAGDCERVRALGGKAYAERCTGQGNAGDVPSPPPPDGERSSSERVIVFRGPGRGQGIGSMMRGVAAAIALGQQHNRRLCVSWRDFEKAFKPVDAFKCPSKVTYQKQSAGNTAA